MLESESSRPQSISLGVHDATFFTPVAIMGSGSRDPVSKGFGGAGIFGLEAIAFVG